MSHSVPFLTLLIILPAVGGTALALLGLDKRLPKELADWLAILVSLATLVVAVLALVTMKEHFGGFQLVSNRSYTGDTLGIRWFLGVDGISIFLVLLSALLFPLVLLTGQHKPKPRAYAAWMLLLEAAVMGSFLSLDLIVFFFFFELTLVPAYFIIAGWGHERRAYAAVKFFLYTFLGSAFLPHPGLHPPVPDGCAHVLAARARAHPSVVVH
jgi:NADH-quinone oxidoreductase subunit M